MEDTYLSFYLRNNRIHVFLDMLRGIGNPKYICFLIDEKGETLAITPYEKKDFHSHRVPNAVYHGQKSLEVSSKSLCQILAKMYDWDLDCSYRVPGKVLKNNQVAIFYLKKSFQINQVYTPAVKYMFYH